jgi:hypothetical protein
MLIWKEISKGNWDIIYEYYHSQSINSVDICSHEYGLIITSVSSDNSICCHEYDGKKKIFYFLKNNDYKLFEYNLKFLKIFSKPSKIQYYQTRKHSFQWNKQCIMGTKFLNGI